MISAEYNASHAVLRNIFEKISKIFFLSLDFPQIVFIVKCFAHRLPADRDIPAVFLLK